MPDSQSKVLSERRGRTFLVSINRPEVRNCVDSEAAQLLFDAVETFRADDSLDVLVLTGAGETAFRRRPEGCWRSRCAPWSPGVRADGHLPHH